jgi:hypothetical protein
MKNVTKTAIIGGAGLLAAYLLLVRPQTAKRRRSEESLIEDEDLREKFNRLPLKAHEFLADAPLHSLDYAELKGGRERMTIAEIYDAAGLSDLGKVELGAVTQILFDLRGMIGKFMRWDDVPQLVREFSYLPRLTAEERAKSLVLPGEVRGISQVLYCFGREMVLEIINKTVHCFWVLASEPTADGYNLYNAVYVKNLNWRTPIYMTLISPFLKWIIYPEIGKSIEQNWKREFPNGAKERGAKLLTL